MLRRFQEPIKYCTLSKDIAAAYKTSVYLLCRTFAKASISKCPPTTGLARNGKSVYPPSPVVM
jgi:hypothetical protein